MRDARINSAKVCVLTSDDISIERRAKENKRKHEKLQGKNGKG